MTANRTLIIPRGPDSERDAVAEAWQAGGNPVERLDKFWQPPPSLASGQVCLYGPVIFCEVLAQLLNLQLVSPAEDLLVSLPRPFIRRDIRLMSLREALALRQPRFLKPLQPKLFTAGVYPGGEELQSATQGLEPNTLLLASEVVHFQAEVRLFVHRGIVLDACLYQGQAKFSGAIDVATELAQFPGLPNSYVADLGLLEETWVVVEFNPAWGAGLNGCSAYRILPAIAGATLCKPSS